MFSPLGYLVPWAYPIDGAYYSDAPLFDGADGGAAGGDAGGCGGMAVTQIGPIVLAH